MLKLIFRSTVEKKNHTQKHHTLASKFSTTNAMSTQTNEQLFQTFRANAKGKRKEKKEVGDDEKSLDSKRAHYKPLIDQLVQFILHDWTGKASKASEKGFTKTNLLTYKDGAKFDGKTVGVKGSALPFLLKGPREDPKFWESLGFEPVLVQVQKAVAPAIVYHWFTGHKNGTVIEISWNEDDIAEGSEYETTAAVAEDTAPVVDQAVVDQPDVHTD